MLRKIIVTNLIVAASSMGCQLALNFEKEQSAETSGGGKANRGGNTSLAGNATKQASFGGAATGSNSRAQSTNTSSGGATSSGASSSVGGSNGGASTVDTATVTASGGAGGTSVEPLTSNGGVGVIDTTGATVGGGATTTPVVPNGGATSPATTSDATGGTPAATTTSTTTVTTTGGTATGGRATGGAATGTGGTAKKPNGAAATKGSECLSNIVADGVCCDKQCTGCNACSGSPLTAGPAGQCSYVVAGQVAHSACTASGTTCGLDGKCDGAGECRYSPAEGASCDEPSNLCTTGRVCQNHVCTPGTTKTCNSPPACKLSTTCSAGACNYTQNAPNGTKDTKCPAATQYCFGGGCHQCKNDDQCGVPTPSCHGTSHTCVCRMPSSSNLLTNPGFDGSFSGWDRYPNGTVEMALADDSEGCAQSNSVYVESGDNAFVQCIPLDEWKTYSFGGRFKGGDGNGNFRFLFFDQPNCAGNILDSGNFWELRLAASTTWQSQSGSLRPPAGTKSAQMHGMFLYTYIDQLYLNTSDQF